MTKQQEITSVLRAEIRRGLYPRGSRLPSEQELAERFQASTITINKAVGSLVQEGYLERSARSRRGTIVKTNTLYPEGNLFFLTTITINFSSEIVHGAVHFAGLKNYSLSLLMPPLEHLTETLNKLNTANCRGLLTNSYGLLPPQPFPVIYVDTALEHEEEVTMVRCDSYGGSRELMKQLWRRGHRNMVYFSDYAGTCQSLRRLGFRDFLREQGVQDLEHRFFIAKDNSVHAAQNQLQKILNRYPDCSAIVCATDLEAFHLICAGTRLGIDVMERFALTGFGNVKEVQSLYPLPTVEQHPYELGMRACEKLIEIAEGHESGKNPGLEVTGVEVLNAGIIPTASVKTS